MFATRPTVPLPLVLLAMIFCAALAANPAASPDRIVWGSVAPVAAMPSLKPTGPSADDDETPIGQFVANFHPIKSPASFRLPAPDAGDCDRCANNCRDCRSDYCDDCGRRMYFDGSGWYPGKAFRTFAHNWRASGLWYPGKILRRWRCG